MEESDHTQAVSAPSSSTLAVGASSSSSSSSPVLGEPQGEQLEEPQGEQLEDGNDHRQFYLPPQEQQRQPSSVSYRVNISISDVATGEIRDDVWSCLVVLVTFWFFGLFPCSSSWIYCCWLNSFGWLPRKISEKRRNYHSFRMLCFYNNKGKSRLSLSWVEAYFLWLPIDDIS